MDSTFEEELAERELVAALRHSACTAGTGSQSSGSQMAAVESISGDALGGQIEKLRHARSTLVADRKRLMKELNMQIRVDADCISGRRVYPRPIS